jgi:hypothetical protein
MLSHDFLFLVYKLDVVADVDVLKIHSFISKVDYNNSTSVGVCKKNGDCFGVFER